MEGAGKLRLWKESVPGGTQPSMRREHKDFFWEDSVMRRLFSMRILFLALLVFLVPGASRAQVSVGVSVRVGPPALPVYEQPPCPVEGYLWTPGYWAYGDEGYYWVPGVWVAPPRVGVLWTPGY